MINRFVFAGLLAASITAHAQPVQRAPINVKVDKNAVKAAPRPVEPVVGQVFVASDVTSDGRTSVAFDDARTGGLGFATRVAAKGPAYFNVLQSRLDDSGGWSLNMIGAAKGDTFHVVTFPNDAKQPATRFPSTFFTKFSLKNAPHIVPVSIDRYPADATSDDLLFVMPVHTAKSFFAPVGSWWDPGLKRWCVINEAQSQIPQATQFHTLLVKKADPDAFVFTVSSKNPDGPARLPIAKAGRNDIVLVTHRATPGQILARPFSIAQEPDTGQWQIVTDKPLVDGTQFNVLVVRKK